MSNGFSGRSFAHHNLLTANPLLHQTSKGPPISHSGYLLQIAKTPIGSEREITMSKTLEVVLLYLIFSLLVFDERYDIYLHLRFNNLVEPN